MTQEAGRRRRRRHIGKGPISDILGSIGLGRKRRVRGKGFLDVLKGIGNFAKDHLLPVVRDVGVGLLKKRIGLGKRRVHRRRVGCGAHYKKVIKM